MKPARYQSSHLPLTLGLLRRYAMVLLSDCAGAAANYLRSSVEKASTKADLLRLRPAIFECMAVHLGEAEAMARIRSLDLSI